MTIIIRTIVSLLLSIVFIVWFFDWFFEKYPEARASWQSVKGFLANMYQQHGLIATVFAVVAIFVLIQAIVGGKKG